MPQDRAGAVILDPSFFAAPQMPGLRTGVAAGRQAGQQASQDAFDFAYPKEALDSEADLMDEYVKGVQGLRTMFETGMAKGLNPARPDLSNPESVALHRAFSDAYAENYQLANALRTSKEARDKYTELRLREGLAAATMDTGGLMGMRDIERGVIQTRPFDDIVTEFNRMSSEFQTRGAAGQFDQHRAQAEAAIDELARQRINQGDNPREVEIARDAAKAKLRRSIYDPPVFAPDRREFGDDRSQRLDGYRARMLDLTGLNGPEQATRQAMALAGETIDYRGQEYVIESGHYHTTDGGKRQLKFMIKPTTQQLKTVEEVIEEQGFKDSKPLIGRGKTAEQKAQEWLDQNSGEFAAWRDAVPEEVTFDIPSASDPQQLLYSEGAGQLNTFLGSARSTGDKFMLEEVLMGVSQGGRGLPDTYAPQPTQAQPDANGVVVGPLTGRPAGPGRPANYKGRVGTMYKMADGTFRFVPQ